MVANSDSTVAETLSVEESNVVLHLPTDVESGTPSTEVAESLATLSLSHVQDIVQ